MKMRIFAIAGALAGFAVAASVSPFNLPAGLPSAATAKTILNFTPRHREWASVPLGSKSVLAFIVYPERSDKAPVVVVTARDQGASDWVRAVSDRVAAAGFIAVVPDVLTGLGLKGGDTDSYSSPAAVAEALRKLGSAEIERRTSAVRDYALALPAADGQSAVLSLDESRIAAGTAKNTADFELSQAGWGQALEYLTQATGNHPVFAPNNDEHAAHYAMLAKAQESGRADKSTTARSTQAGGSLADKRPNLPANYYTAKSTVARSKLRKEWVDIPVGEVKVHTWIEYPEGEGKAGIVIVMQHGTGMDIWVRAVADQLAHDGFIAVAPDMWSGTGANGGGLDSFQFVDDAIKAGVKVGPDETMRRFKAARDYALKLPRANGKTASLGFCAGGGNSFRFAGEVPELNAAVVFYGTPPDDATMSQIKAPVLGFYGENDARVTSTVQPTIGAMEKLGKVYEPHIYPKATHSFVMFQDAGANTTAIEDAWPRAIAFLKKHIG